MSQRKGVRPEQYVGAFRQYEDVPSRYCLETYAQQYRDEDTWQRYRDEILLPNHDYSKTIKRTARTGGNSWLDHMDERDRHHALATPADVEAWSQKLLNGDRTRRYCYETYFVRIYQFYDYLKTSYQHPYLYNPLLLAAINYEATRNLWMYRIDTRPEVVDRD